MKIVEEGFERFPEKVIIFQAPLLALYFVFGGHRRMNLLQLSRLTGIFHRFIHTAILLEKKGVISLGKEFRKIPVFSER